MTDHSNWLTDPSHVSDVEHVSLIFVRYWAESVLEQAQRVKNIQTEVASIRNGLNRTYREEERNIGEEYSYSSIIANLEESLDRAISKRIVYEHILASSSWQMEEWKKRFEEERRQSGHGQETPDRELHYDSSRPWYFTSDQWVNGTPTYAPSLQLMRNAMEHLSEAQRISEFHIATDPDSSECVGRSLRVFPDSRYNFTDSLFNVFNDIDIDQLEQRAKDIRSWMRELGQEAGEALAHEYQDDYLDEED